MLYSYIFKNSSLTFSDYKEYNTDTTVKFQILMQKDKLKKAELEGFHKIFKLQSVLTLTSMVSIL